MEKSTQQILYNLIPPCILLITALVLFDIAQIRVVQQIIQQEIYLSAIELKLIPAFLSFLLIFLYNKSIRLRFSETPFKVNLFCGIAFFIYLDIFALPKIQIDQLLFLIGKSSSFLIIVFFGTFIPIFENKYQQLTQKQILIACGLTLVNLIQHGIFNIYYESHQTNFYGFFSLFLYFMASSYCFNRIASIKEEYEPSASELAQNINMWLTIFLLIFSIWNSGFILLFKTFFTNFSFCLWILGMSFGWIFVQIFAFKLIKEFRLHIFPMVFFTYNSIKFQIFDDEVSLQTTVIYSLVISALFIIGIFFEIKRSQKINIAENGGSEVGLRVAQNYEMMRN